MDRSFPTSVRAHHMFSRILNFLFVIVFRDKKVPFDKKKLHWHFIINFDSLDENPFRQTTNCKEKNPGFVDSRFVKTCDENFIGQKILTGLLMLRTQRVLPVT